MSLQIKLVQKGINKCICSLCVAEDYLKKTVNLGRSHDCGDSYAVM